MFSNNLIKSIARNSDENNLKLSKEDWHHVINANKNFTEENSQWKGNEFWGKFLRLRLGTKFNKDFTNSLELCCGNGFIYFSLKEIALFDNTSFHMDLSKQQLEDFKVRCNKNSIEFPNLIHGDIGSIPFENEYFNTVYGYSYLHHLPDVELYLAEAFRVLKPGGVFYALHEPNATAIIFESFPVNLFKKINYDSLTDIWLIKPEIIYKMLIKTGFKKIYIQPGGFFYSLFINPIYFLFVKFNLNYNSNFFVRAKIFCQKIDNLMPLLLRKKICPSICIVAIK